VLPADAPGNADPYPVERGGDENGRALDLSDNGGLNLRMNRLVGQSLIR
jgi:hypothetical protein